MSKNPSNKVPVIHSFVFKNELSVVRTCLHYLLDKSTKSLRDVVIDRIVRARKEIGVTLTMCGLNKQDLEKSGKLGHLTKTERKRLAFLFS